MRLRSKIKARFELGQTTAVSSLIDSAPYQDLVFREVRRDFEDAQAVARAWARTHATFDAQEFEHNPLRSAEGMVVGQRLIQRKQLKRKRSPKEPIGFKY